MALVTQPPGETCACGACRLARLQAERDAAVQAHQDWLDDAWRRGQRQAAMHSGLVRTTDPAYAELIRG